ncbi:unnamed protein product [Rhizophagus irregularis]|nr:unnamed protein product [Rhizophagus irregularis]
MIWETYKSITNTIYEKLEDLVNKDVEKPPLALRVVQLPEFTINNHASQQNKPGRATYLLITEIIQFMYEWKRYISDIYNFFDIFSIIFPVIVISNMVRDFRFENGFGSVETIDSELKVMISFSASFLWIEVISYLRLIPNIAIYIYYNIIIKPC